MLTATIISASVLCIAATVLFFVYRAVFFIPKHHGKTNPHQALKSPYLDGIREKIKAQIDEISAYPCEEIRIKSYDGTSLFARYYKSEEKKGLCILFHGYKGSSYTETSGLALAMMAHGLDVLIPDQRAHGKSCGTTVTFGIRERRDCLEWVNWVNAVLGKGTKIFLFGISMGASSVLMSLGLNMPKSVLGAIADCPYSEPRDIISRVLKNRGLSPRLLYPIITLAALVFGRFRLNSASLLSAVGDSDIPILLIHGTSDNFVPFSMSEAIRDRSKSAALLPISGAGHCASFSTDAKNYTLAVLSFIDKNIKEQEKNNKENS